MAQHRGGFALSAPRLATLAASLLPVLAAGVSLRHHLPVGHGFVAAHRFAFAAAGYGVLALGALVPRL